jgi:asparagine synthetase B (glutamine-hydrolysing)
MFVAWTGGMDGPGARACWPELRRVDLQPSTSLGVAVATASRATLELRPAIAAVSIAPPWGPDAASVADAYTRHHHGLLRHLDGDFAAVILDFERGTLFGTSSLTSPQQLAFCSIAGAVLVSDRALDLLRHPAVPRSLDEQHLAHVVTGLTVAPSGTTALRTIRRLCSGEAIEARGGEQKLVRIDRLAPSRRRAFTGIERCTYAFWRTLEDAVRRRVPRGARPCLSYSGGIDSTVTGLAMTGDGDRPAAFSLVGESAPAPAGLPGVHVKAIDGRRAGDITELDRHSLRDDPPLTPMHFIPAQLRLWKAIRDAGFDTVFEGEGGDELFALNVSPLQALRRGQLATALGVLRRHPQPRSLFWRGFVLPHLPAVARSVWYRRWERGDWLPGYLVRERIADPCVRRAQRVLSGEMVHRGLARGIQDWLSSPLRIGARLAYEGLARECGVEIAMPMIDREIIELVLAIPPRWMLSPDFDKAFLRRALRGRVADDVRMRPKDARLDRELEPELLLAPSTRDLLADARVRERLREWVRFQTVERILDDVAGGYRPPPRQLWQLQCLVAFAQWYRRASREYGVD